MTMKRSTVLFALVAIAMLITAPIGMTACSQDNWMRTSYRSMVSAAATYNVVMESAADARSHGEISEGDFSRLKEYAQVYYDAYQKAADVLIMISAETENGGTPSDAMLRILTERLADVGKLMNDLLYAAQKAGLKLEGVE